MTAWLKRLASGTASTLVAAAVLAGGSTIVSVVVLTWRASATEDVVDSYEKRLGSVERNQVKLDLSQRQLSRDAEWMQAKLDALLAASGLDVPPRPSLPVSELEPPR